MRKMLWLNLLAVAVAAAVLAVPPPAGSAAPDFNLATPDGKRLSLSDTLARHKAAVIIFIATRCPYSNAYNERMAAYAAEYGARGVKFIGINSNANEPPEEVARHGREHRFPFPVVKDPDSRVADSYGARHTPEVYVIDAKGMLRYHGRIDDAYEDPGNPKKIACPDLRNALDALLADRPIARPDTKAFGCSIKRR